MQTIIAQYFLAFLTTIWVGKTVFSCLKQKTINQIPSSKMKQTNCNQNHNSTSFNIFLLILSLLMNSSMTINFLKWNADAFSVKVWGVICWLRFKPQLFSFLLYYHWEIFVLVTLLYGGKSEIQSNYWGGGANLKFISILRVMNVLIWMFPCVLCTAQCYKTAPNEPLIKIKK